MTQAALRVAGFAAVYLLVLTSLHPGDVALAVLLGACVAVGLRQRGAGRAAGRPVPPSLRAAAAVIAATSAEMVVGTWRTARFCLSRRSRAGFVEIPRAGRSRRNVALWGVLTGEAPDEIPVDVDEERDVLIVHLIDASDPDAVRRRHEARSRDQRKVVH
jgi:multisubunit Na+/H+ antiporter MnhE subunit